MHVQHLLEGLQGGFTGPDKPAIVLTPQKRVSAFAKTPTPKPVAPKPIYNAGYSGGANALTPRQRVATNITFYDESQVFQYTPEQIRQLKERGLMRPDQSPEVSDSQKTESPEIDYELEQFSDEQNATEKAIKDSAGGSEIFDAESIAVDESEKKSLTPLVLLGVLSYFLF